MKKSIYIWLSLILLLNFNCGSSDTNKSADAKVDKEVYFDGIINPKADAQDGTECINLNETQCKDKNTECMAIYGKLKSANADEYLSCEKLQGCDQAYHCAWPTNDSTKCYIFKNSCVPSGWTTALVCSKYPNCPQSL